MSACPACHAPDASRARDRGSSACDVSHRARAVPLRRVRMAPVRIVEPEESPTGLREIIAPSRKLSSNGWNRQPRRRPTVTDQERQKAEELISRLEISVGQVFPRDGGNAALLASMIQTLNGLRSLLGVVRPH
jgi:hypothetical protein